MYITTTFLGPTNTKGSRIQFSLIDNNKKERRKEFSYHEDAPEDFTIPFKRTRYITSLLRDEKTMLYKFEQFIEYINRELGFKWKPTDFIMTHLDTCQYVFTFKMHSIELGD